jgi:hypothetical protein
LWVALYRARATTTHKFVLLKRPACGAAHRSCALRAPPNLLFFGGAHRRAHCRAHFTAPFLFVLAARTAARIAALQRTQSHGLQPSLAERVSHFTHSHT